MRLYINGDYKKQISYGYLELAGKMWFPEKEQNSYSNAGDNDALQNNFFVHLSLRKTEIDIRWKKIPIQDSIQYRFQSHIYENIWLDVEDGYMSDYREKGKYLRILSTHQSLLTLDKRAIYIMAIEVASALDGLISEDDKNTWLTIEEFISKHQDILSLTFEEANERSLEEITIMEAVEEPLWEELDRQREAYIAKHGERVYPDDEE